MAAQMNAVVDVLVVLGQRRPQRSHAAEPRCCAAHRLGGCGKVLWGASRRGPRGQGRPAARGSNAMIGSYAVHAHAAYVRCSALGTATLPNLEYVGCTAEVLWAMGLALP
jgi:hypothetical protein